MTYDDDLDDENFEEQTDVPDETYSFKVLDLVGSLIHIAGRASMGIGGGLMDIADMLHKNAWHARVNDVEVQQRALDMAKFDAIASHEEVPPWTS